MKCLVPLAALVAAVPVAFGIVTGPGINAQTPAAAAPPTFEVASVKPNASGAPAFLGMGFQPGRFTATNATLRELMKPAYSRRFPDYLPISGGPDWVDSDRYDIVATTPIDLATVIGRGDAPGAGALMLRALLEDRFKLVVHMDTEDRPVYQVVVATRDGRPGPGLLRSDVDCAAILDRMGKGERPPPVRAGQGPPCSIGPRPGRLQGNAITMAQLADVLSTFANRAVVDRTGLEGAFDLTIEWTPEQQGAAPPGTPGAASAFDAAPSIFAALEQQLGLKLESARAPVQVLVIDRAERPTPD
jgi:uncharacterized protein (TIGR03435 family)